MRGLLLSCYLSKIWSLLTRGPNCPDGLPSIPDLSLRGVTVAVEALLRKDASTALQVCRNKS